MRVGTKSLLFGVHAFWLHPFMVALAWWKLYGFPLDPRLWAAFFLHDIGYWGCETMDGPDGKWHPTLGAEVMGRLFDRAFHPDWEWFTCCHSRWYANRFGRRVSRLCVADKLALELVPRWLYLTLATLTGEIHEYMSECPHKDFTTRAWHTWLCNRRCTWIEENAEVAACQPR